MKKALSWIWEKLKALLLRLWWLAVEIFDFVVSHLIFMLVMPMYVTYMGADGDNTVAEVEALVSELYELLFMQMEWNQVIKMLVICGGCGALAVWIIHMILKSIFVGK